MFFSFHCLFHLRFRLQREAFPDALEAWDFTPVFQAMVAWTSVAGVKGKAGISNLAMSATLVASVLDLTSEEAIKKRLDLASYKRLPKAFEVVVRFVEIGHKCQGEFGAESEENLLWAITSNSEWEGGGVERWRIVVVVCLLEWKKTGKR